MLLVHQGNFVLSNLDHSLGNTFAKSGFKIGTIKQIRSKMCAFAENVVHCFHGNRKTDVQSSPFCGLQSYIQAQYTHKHAHT